MITADSLNQADSILTADGLLPSVVTGGMSLPENYRAQLAALLPTGLAWPREPDSTLQRLLAGWAESYARVDDAPTTDALRAQLLRRLTGLNSPTPAYFVDLAAAFGFAITITEFDPTTVEDDVDAAILDLPWAYAWQVNTALAGDVTPISVEDNVDALLESWNNNDALECLINRAKPAHTTTIYSYA